MEQFSLEKYLENPSRKITTRYGDREVRIICTDRKDKRPIVALMIDLDDGSEYITSHSINGWIDDEEKYPDKRDLFFADEKEELTEFEEVMVSFTHTMFDYLLDKTKEVDIKEWKGKLLDLARKEIEKEYRIVDKDDSNWEDGYKQGKQDVLKDLPKWEKITEEKQNYLAYGYLSHDGYYLSIQELKDKLPKEE